jgi:hypothetical protein
MCDSAVVEAIVFVTVMVEVHFEHTHSFQIDFIVRSTRSAYTSTSPEPSSRKERKMAEKIMPLFNGNEVDARL